MKRKMSIEIKDKNRSNIDTIAFNIFTNIKKKEIQHLFKELTFKERREQLILLWNGLNKDEKDKYLKNADCKKQEMLKYKECNTTTNKEFSNIKLNEVVLDGNKIFSNQDSSKINKPTFFGTFEKDCINNHIYFKKHKIEFPHYKNLLQNREDIIIDN